MSEAVRWRRCSTCKRDIGLDTTYWTCSVSTCNRVRSALQFCSVSCWDAHVPILRHRDAWAVEGRSPRQPEPAAGANRPPARPPAKPAGESSKAPAPAPPKSESPARPLVRKSGGPSMTPPQSFSASPAPRAGDEPEREILIVVSKLKRYIRERSGMNTSDGCADPLSDWVRAICDRAIQNARDAERKTVLERDIPRPT